MADFNTRTGLIVGTLIAFAFVCGAAAPALAKDFAVKSMIWKNKGGYVGEFRVGFTTTNETKDKKVKCFLKKTGPIGEVRAEVGYQVVYNLNSVPNSWIFKKDSERLCMSLSRTGPTVLNPGDVVWGVVKIITGERKSCRKDGDRFIYHPCGGVVTYKTAGTTLDNNNCKIVREGGVLWDDVKDFDATCGAGTDGNSP